MAKYFKHILSKEIYLKTLQWVLKRFFNTSRKVGELRNYLKQSWARKEWRDN